jgi:chorismate mutase / prephenate dehydratase
VAAVSSPLAKDVYGLELVHAGIADNANNITRFFVIGDKEPEPTGEDKTTVVFSVKDEVGVLHRMLAPFSRNKINLTKIESRPSKRKPWEYLFFLDFNGHVQEPAVGRALKRLGESCNFLKVLGSYPCSL